jgi:trehalose-phosphatase
VPDFWPRVARSRYVVLMLDYDGTLAPFRVDRHTARPLPGVIDTLLAIQAQPNTLLALISGRPVAEIDLLVGADRFMIAGTHGFELFQPGSGLTQHALELSERAILDVAEEQAACILGPQWTERKIATVAAHVRHLPAIEAERVVESLAERWIALTNERTEVRRFNGGVEIRVRGRDKGSVVRELLAMAPPDALAVYIGDDDTDEDAFKALPDGGIGIKVGNAGAATAAQGRMASCETVRQFLWDWNHLRQST